MVNDPLSSAWLAMMAALGRHGHARQSHPLRHNGIKRIDPPGGFPGMSEKPCALTEIVEYEHHFDKHPACGDIAAPAVTQIGIESLGTGRTQKHRTHDHEPRRTRHKELHRIPRIESLQHLRTRLSRLTAPSTPSIRNHASMNGPKQRPMRPVPTRCIMKISNITL